MSVDSYLELFTTLFKPDGVGRLSLCIRRSVRLALADVWHRGTERRVAAAAAVVARTNVGAG